jgi:hypothetical protein
VIGKVIVREVVAGEMIPVDAVARKSMRAKSVPGKSMRAKSVTHVDRTVTSKAMEAMEAMEASARVKAAFGPLQVTRQSAPTATLVARIAIVLFMGGSQ